VCKREGIIDVSTVLEALVSFHPRWIGQMHPVAFPHQVVYQPVQVEGGFNNYACELISIRLEGRDNQPRIIQQLFLKDPSVPCIDDADVVTG
jgi:hypothetical protein